MDSEVKAQHEQVDFPNESKQGKVDFSYTPQDKKKMKFNKR